MVSYEGRRFLGGLVASALLCAGTALPGVLTAGEPGRHVQIEQEGLVLNGWLTEVDSPVATVLMLHGTLAHANMEIMTAFAEALAEQDIETLRVTLSLGMNDREGMFDCQTPHRHRHADAVGELAAWVRWLEDNARSDVVLLGHSRATNQVIRLAARQAGLGLARGVVLVAPSVYRPGGAELSDRQAEARERARAMVAAGEGEALMQDVDILHCPGAEATAESFLSYYDDDPEYYTLRLAAGTGLPVLVVLGSEDTINDGVEEALAALENDDHMSLLEVDGADHFFRDLYAYDVAEGIRAWLGENLSR